MMTMLIDGFVMDGSLGRGVGCIGGIVEPDTGVAADVFSLSSCLKAFSLRSSFTFLLRSKLSSSCLNASMNPNHKLIMHICMYLCMYVCVKCEQFRTHMNVYQKITTTHLIVLLFLFSRGRLSSAYTLQLLLQPTTRNQQLEDVVFGSLHQLFRHF